MTVYRFLLFLAMLFVVLAGSPGLAQIDGAANTSKEGSLLIWPAIQTGGGSETYIFVNNSSASDVLLKCYWEVKYKPADPAGQALYYNFAMWVPGSSPVVFRASDGASLDGQGVAAGIGDSERGVLKCWAVDDSMRRQISWNHLSGSAIIVQGDSMSSDSTASTASAWQYSAWRFAANVIASDGTFADGFWVGTVMGVSADSFNTLALKASPTTVVDPTGCTSPYAASYCSLSNAAYDACPKYVSFNFLSEPSGMTKTDGYAFNNLAVVSCQTGYTETALSTMTELAYTIWNGNSVAYSGLRKCTNCFSTTDLGSLSVLRVPKPFQKKYLKTPVGHFRVEGMEDAACGADTVYTPVLGAMSSKLVDTGAFIGMNGSTSGKETSSYGYISWVPTGAYYQMKARRR